MDINI
jgi:hypothetical protein